MKFMILTTETLHHTFFVKEIKKIHRNIIDFSEKINNASILYNTDHPFEMQAFCLNITLTLKGLEYCFSEEGIKQLKTRGVKFCPAAIKGVNKRNSDPFRLKRIMVNSQ